MHVTHLHLFHMVEILQKFMFITFQCTLHAWDPGGGCSAQVAAYSGFTV